jgi:hypothetical protein
MLMWLFEKAEQVRSAYGAVNIFVSLKTYNIVGPSLAARNPTLKT